MSFVHKEPTIVVAYDQQRCIGDDNDLPWAGELPRDMRHFKDLTTGNIVIMGRATFESIGRPLPGRENRVISRQEGLEIPGCTVYTDPEDALVIDYDDPRELFVIGGEQIYRAYLPLARLIVATEIAARFHGDTYFPVLPEDWHELSREHVSSDQKNHYDCDFVSYQRGYKYIDLTKARSAEQYEQFRRIDIDGECPFCPDAIESSSPDEMNVVAQGQHWTVIANMIPYAHTDTHLVLIAHDHVEKPEDLTPESWADLHTVISEYTRDLPYGGIALRFGDFTHTGASVAHLHVHILKPEDNLDEDSKVRFKVSR